MHLKKLLSIAIQDPDINEAEHVFVYIPSYSSHVQLLLFSTSLISVVMVTTVYIIYYMLCYYVAVLV